MDSSGTSASGELEGNSSTSAHDFGIQTAAVAFAPFFLIELLVAVVSNIILLVLIARARKVINSTNVYLLSLAIKGLIESVVVFNILVTVLARRWIFGPVYCAVSAVSVVTISLVSVLIHLALSRDRYKAVKNPLKKKRSLKSSFIVTALVWGTVLTFLIVSTAVTYSPPSPGVNSTNLVCFGNPEDREALKGILSAIILLLVLTAISVVTLAHYIWIIKELRQVEKLRAQFSIQNGPVLRVNGRDKPLHCTTEERKVRSLIAAYAFELACKLPVYALSLIENVAKALGSSYVANTELVVLLFLFMLPSTMPLVLMVTNKRFRRRMTGILRGKLDPELPADLVVPVIKRATVKSSVMIPKERQVCTLPVEQQDGRSFPHAWL